MLSTRLPSPLRYLLTRQAIPFSPLPLYPMVSCLLESVVIMGVVMTSSTKGEGRDPLRPLTRQGVGGEVSSYGTQYPPGVPLPTYPPPPPHLTWLYR